MTDGWVPSIGVREAAEVADGMIDYVDAAIEGIIGAAVPDQERSPLRVFASTQRLQMLAAEMHEIVRQLMRR